MRKYYLIRLIYKNKNMFAIWYSDDEDGFVVEGHRLVTFESIDDAKVFAEKRHILLESEIAIYDFSNVIELIGQIDDSKNCRTIINMWNLLSDLAKTLNEEFMGDSDQEQILDIYNKLFYGSNLKVISQGNEEYYPSFDDSEREKCISIFINGFSILDKLLIAK